jgi:contact-dependent growth inhibition (CDI) system CdiI-like immunity protein
MSAHESFPNLWQFLGGYFHQDWMHDASDPDDIIKVFVNDSSNDVLASVRTELNKLLNQDLSDADLRELLTKLGCYVHYPAFGMTAREWLTQVRARLSELADAKRAGKVI